MKLGESVVLDFGNDKIGVSYANTFGDVEKGKSLIMKDDYSRVEVAINMGNFSEIYTVRLGDECLISRNLG